MTDYAKLIERLESADTVAYGHYGDGTYANEDHALPNQAAAAIRALLADRQTGINEGLEMAADHADKTGFPDVANAIRVMKQPAIENGDHLKG
jgi:hypothetical protein